MVLAYQLFHEVLLKDPQAFRSFRRFAVISEL